MQSKREYEHSQKDAHLTFQPRIASKGGGQQADKLNSKTTAIKEPSPVRASTRLYQNVSALLCYHTDMPFCFTVACEFGLSPFRLSNYVQSESMRESRR
jgi:hypothetical protein